MDLGGGGREGGYDDVASLLRSSVTVGLTSMVEQAGMILSAFLHARAPFLIASKILGAGNCNSGVVCLDKRFFFLFLREEVKIEAHLLHHAFHGMTELYLLLKSK